ncbi:uncharacterized protein LOC110459049, partial [Mizuhopecten yessoensis]|uniref:uncharacterized protein LOC110459049 n=1 Tax=Mizuhopecten yessoensis TaxID=6573 RepID=UPI000B458850
SYNSVVTNGVSKDTHDSSHQPDAASSSPDGDSSNNEQVGGLVAPPSPVKPPGLDDSDQIIVTVHPAKTNGVESDNSIHLDSSPEAQSQLDQMWQQLEAAMVQSQDRVRGQLQEFGIGDGEEDSESEEGQMWRMVQGDSPYTIQLV